MASSPQKSLPTVFVYPLLLLLVTSAVQFRLRQPRILWQPPALESDAPVPERIWVGWSLLGFPLFEPGTIAAQAQLWSSVAAGTLLISLILIFGAHRFRSMPFRPLKLTDTLLSATAPWLPRLALILFPLYAAEVLAIAYFGEILFDGAILYATPGMALVIAAGAIGFTFGFRGAGEIEMPPTRVNGILLPAERQPELYALPGVEDVRIAATLSPALALIAGRTQCQEEVIDGRLLLIPLTLCRVLTREELVCLAALACEPLSWPGVGWQYEDSMQAIHRLQRRIVETLQTSLLARICPGTLPALGLCGYMSEHHAGMSASHMYPTPDGDRATAAKFGSLDLARALLKTFVFQHVWPKFELKMKQELVRGEKGAADYEWIALQAAHTITAEAILSAYAELEKVRHPLALYDRLARLGYDGPDAWPKLDFSPDEPAFDMVTDGLAIERELSTAERARFVLAVP